VTDAPTPAAAAPSSKNNAQETMAQALQQGIGGPRGFFDSSLPTAVFLVVYLVSGSQLSVSLWAALAAGALIAVLRMVRKESLQQIVGGIFGVGVAAFIASRTGKAEDFFLPGIITNVAYATAFAISAAIRKPLLGYIAGGITGHPLAWRDYPRARRAAVLASWLWAGMFGLRLLVQVPLYFAAAIGPLGVVKLIMGWPLFLLVSYMTYRILAPEFSTIAEIETAKAEEASATTPSEEKSTVEESD